MKEGDACAGPRRRRRRGRRCSVNRTILSIYTAAIFGGHCEHVTSCCSPRATSLQYDDVLTSRSYNSILRIRGGEDASSFEHLGKIRPSWRAKTDTADMTSTHDRTKFFAATLNRPHNRGLWKRINFLRGGVDDEKCEDDDFVEPEPDCNVDESESMTTSTSVTEATSELFTTDDQNPRSTFNSWKEISESVSSFFSRFRAPVLDTNTDHLLPRATNTTSIAHKMPHGPDGRGGGMTLSDQLQKPSTFYSRDRDRKEDYVLTTEITNAAFHDEMSGETIIDTVEPMTNIGNKPSDRNSAAFAVHPNILSSNHVDTRKDGYTKMKKASKIKDAVVELNETKVMNITSMSKAVNETDAIMPSIRRDNITKHYSLLGETSSANKISDGLQLKDYTSSGYWVGIDLIASLGLSSVITDLKISRTLRPVRKFAAKTTGLHGLLSGKEYTKLHHLLDTESAIGGKASTVISIDEELGIHDANAIEAEILARRFASRKWRRRIKSPARSRGSKNPGRRWGFRRANQLSNLNGEAVSDYVIVPAVDTSPDAMEQRRRKRVEEIDVLLHRGVERLIELQCERDDLLCAPNPLFNYTKKNDPSTNQTFGDVRTSREFNFPSPELVNEYIGELVSHGRLLRLNHTELWRSRSDNGMDDDEIIGDDLLTPGAGARKLYENIDPLDALGNINKSGGGSWLLRTGLGGNSLGEKLGEAIEIAAYKGVCTAVMSVFARMLSNLHGVNVLSHSDIRMYVEQDPDLPPVDKKYGPMIDESNYAQQVIKTAIQSSSKKKRKSSKSSSSQRSSTRRHGHELSDDAFIQRDAVVETLISHCQISAPLLKLFPMDWQRAMVGNIITLATAIVSDFADGLQVQLLGHALTVSFKPITEADMIQHIGAGSFRQNHRRTRPDEFEAAVLATAVDISENLAFLDGWLEWVERKVGGGVLRAQISNLIARVVLTLIDEVLSGARLDLWSSQANGPRLYAALEYRTSTNGEE